MINTVIFDMDGLLIDSEPLWAEAMQEVFAKLGVNLTKEQYAQTTGLRTQEVVTYWHNHFKWESDSPDKVTNDILDTVTRKILEKGRPMEGMQYILDFFRQRPFKIGLASSSPMRLIDAVLDHFNIRSYFDAVTSAEFESNGKPHPAVYISCAKALGSDVLQCLAFEDSAAGMTAAKAARMKVVVVPDEHVRAQPRFGLADIRLKSLLEFNEETLAGLQ
ncbi:hexitol phosphatase HxpB [Chitinophaga parva]|uniref:Hexitol phosphatase HxpB n=1 Tax=Chitinophaga parva TaxID=2169414 RepID=A0A2T7BPA1_9BACT|nr:hexitol phosphatase HxpB [Chitinophaga parva]PUZ29503.1 hexitol phosphatase HxpB [Chitinophaga parva]